MTQPLLTPYQAQYIAWQLTRQAGDGSVESLASTLVDSQVGLKLRRELFARQDEVEAQRNELIEQLAQQLGQRVEERTGRCLLLSGN